jgi:MoxR-like ATPase
VNVEDFSQDTTLRSTSDLVRHCRGELSKVIAGQENVIDLALITVLCHGNALIEGVPGIAKTLLVKLLGRLLGLEFRRVQATPDLMPADILGTMVLRTQTGEFVLHRGPVFTSFLLVDEINRMPPRTQSSLLECMEERQITIDGVEHALADSFTVFATQNPIDSEGTYPLPEAQLDRFLLKIHATYPTAENERLVLERHHAGFHPRGMDQMSLTPVDLQLVTAAQREVRAVTIEPALYDYLLSIVRKTREWPALLLGASPRAAISLMLVAQAYAALEDRDYLVPDDVKQAVLPVLRHRILLRPEAELEGYDPDRVLADIIASIAVPQR